MSGMETKITDGDYVLDADSCWITVKNFSVHIKKTDEGVVVDIFRLGDENSESIASTYAFDGEAEDDEDEE